MFIRSLVLAITLISASHAQAQSQPTWLGQLDLKGPVTLFTGPSPSAHQAFIDVVNQTQQSLTMEMYHLTDASVASALEAAAKRGVQTTVILDNGGLKNASTANLASEMGSAGARVVASSPAFSITHTKSMVSDHQTAIVSSMNLTEHPESRRDYGLVLTDPDVIAEMESVFATDLTNAASRTNETPALTNANLVWSPINSASKLHDLISSAQTSIVAVAENVFDTGVLADLKAAAARGVKVRVLSPACPLGQKPDRNYAAMQELKAAGVETRQMPDPATPQTPYQHGKMMVVDDARAYVGSINYSYNSLNKARELGIVVNRADVIRGLDAAFDTDFAVSSLTPDVPTCAPVSY